MSKIQITYDGIQHCTALQKKNRKTVPIDCPYTGKGLEFSSGELVAAGLASCMLMSMGTLAQRNKIDISGTMVDAEYLLNQDFSRIAAINLAVNMPRNYTEKDRIRLERASGLCPIKKSFHPEVKISVQFKYPK